MHQHLAQAKRMAVRLSWYALNTISGLPAINSMKAL
jgi:hypothetical protein